MSTAALTVIGIVLFALGLLFSIAFHESGHLAFAKLFGVRVTQYMVGFGRTVWSRRGGETEYGFKAIPLGGYIRMIGMVPPGKDGRQRISTTGMFRQIIEDTRANDRAAVTPGDDGHQFYQLHPFKRIVIMFAGPFMNLILAVGIFAIILVGIGLPTPSTTIQAVSACVIPAAPAGQQQRTVCRPTDPATPAAQAGLRPGDTVVSFNGTDVTGWTQLTEEIRDAAGTTIALGYRRDGRDYTAQVPIIKTERPVLDANGNQVGVAPVGFLGIEVTSPYVRQPFGSAFVRTGQFIGATTAAVVKIPSRIPALWDSIFDNTPRGLDSPVGIVGAGRISGEILASDTSGTDKLVLFLNLLAGFNMSLFLLNLLPLLPLDGGHILGAGIEWVRRGWATLRRKADPGPFDVAKLMPVAYVVALLFIGLTALTLVADIVNPVTLSG